MIDMILFCPACGLQHVDAPALGWDNPPHRSHLCARCGHVWRPAEVETSGVAEIARLGGADSRPLVRQQSHASPPRSVDRIGLDVYWQDLLDKDDRTSPEDCPDMALITREELIGYIIEEQQRIVSALRSHNAEDVAFTAINAMCETEVEYDDRTAARAALTAVTVWLEKIL